jgi:hypothetical protein
MKFSLSKRRRVLAACLGFWPVLLFAQSSDVTQNLGDCKNGFASCDGSRLSESESADVARAEHRRNVSNCRNGYDSCDHSKLTEPEAIAWAVADHQETFLIAKTVQLPATLHD